MDQRLKDKTVIVTGAGSGIGLETALLFGRKGANVVALDIKANQAQAVAEMITKDGGSALSITADVAKETDMQAAVEKTMATFNSIDILINNAAAQIMGPLHECTVEDFYTMVNVNLKGVYLGCKHVIPQMIKQKSGVILSVSSVLGVVGDEDLPIYGATKGAVIALTRSLSVGYGQYGIRASCICPGDVNTPMVKEFFDFQDDPETARAEVNRNYPLGRIAEPSEVASTLVFLASSEASFITGSPVFVDGGLTSMVY